MKKLNFKKLINELNENEIIIKNDNFEIVKINKNDLPQFKNINTNINDVIYKNEKNEIIKFNKFDKYFEFNEYPILKSNDYEILKNNNILNKFYEKYFGEILIYDYEINELNLNENEIYNELLNILINNENYKYYIFKNNNNFDDIILRLNINYK